MTGYILCVGEIANVLFLRRAWRNKNYLSRDSVCQNITTDFTEVPGIQKISLKQNRQWKLTIHGGRDSESNLVKLPGQQVYQYSRSSTARCHSLNGFIWQLYATKSIIQAFHFKKILHMSTNVFKNDQHPMSSLTL